MENAGKLYGHRTDVVARAVDRRPVGGVQASVSLTCVETDGESGRGLSTVIQPNAFTTRPFLG